VELGSLPFARVEAREIEKALGGRSRLLLGPDASEHFLKTADLRPFRILHFAAHAVVDDEKPDHSAVVLAPGAPQEDGLLQIREVLGLDIAGDLVVLATCRSSSGPLLQGEGPLSLARAFFQAGARTVVGSLWSLRDDETARLVAAFYRALGDGLPVAAAMARAQRERIAAGAPAAAWAGLVVLGDGDLVPVQGGQRFPRGLLFASGLALALVAAAIFALRRRRIS
jgi:CHAT domain-containing protein